MKRGIKLKKAHLFFLLFMPALLPSSNFIFAQTLNDATMHFQRGELDETKRILLNHLSQDVVKPQIWFYLGKVEEEGVLSREYFEDLAIHFPEWKNSAEAGILICKYEFCKGMHVTTTDLTKRLQEKYPETKIVPEVLWIRGCSFLAMDQPDSALKQFDKIMQSFPGSNWVDWALLGRGDCFFADENYNQAMAEYQRIFFEYEDSEVFPFALFGLTKCFSQLGDSDKALLYYNLLKERYPLSIESTEDLVEGIGPQGGTEKKTKAERLVGVEYTIQLGVFGIKENALRLRSQFEKQGYSVTIKSKVIRAKKYYVVRLGSFPSYDEALKLKKKLESQTNESYRVVIK